MSTVLRAIGLGALVFLPGLMGCGNENGNGSPLQPLVPKHPIEGTYDATLSFLATTIRTACNPPIPNQLYCYYTDSNAFSKSGVLTISGASASQGAATFTATANVDGSGYVLLDAGYPPRIDAAGTVVIFLREAGDYSTVRPWLWFYSAHVQGDTLSGAIGWGTQPYRWSTGRFTATRQR